MLVCGPSFALSYQDDHWGARVATAKCSVQTKSLWSRVGLCLVWILGERGKEEASSKLLPWGRFPSLLVTVENYFCFLSFQLEL